MCNAAMDSATDSNATMLDDLLDFIDEQEVKELGISTEETFSVKSRSQADYLIGEYAKLQKEVEDVESTCKKALESYTEKINRWKEAELRKREAPMTWIGARLRAYAEAELADSKRKSLSLPNGKLQFSKSTKMHYDEEVLFKFLEMHKPEFLKEQPKKIDKSGLKKICEEKNGKYYFGDVEVAGMSIETLPDTFKIS